MSEHALPDDLSQWPADPYQLLGVQPEADERAVKKAYTRLIRRYKPEQAPDHFRRIRDAYEQVKRWLQWRQVAQDDNGGATAPQTFALLDVNAPDLEGFVAALSGRGHNGHEANAGADAPAEHSNRRAEKDEVAQLRAACQQARDGEIAAAYEALRALSTSAAGNDESYVRLYWLLRLWPQLEPGRSACHWLVQGMLAQGLSGRLCELYCEYLELDLAEAFTERCTRLLTHGGSPWSRLALARTRWRAAALQGRWHYVGEDLDRLHPLYDDAYEVWARVLLAACEVLPWSRDPAALSLGQRCRLELEQHFGQEVELHDDLDRLDLLDEMVSSCARLQQSERVPPDLIKLLRDSWLFSFHQLRNRLQGVLMPLVAAPRESLWLLDFIHNISPVAVIRLGEMIEWLLGNAEWDQQPLTDQQRQTLMRLLLSQGADYGTLRVRLLEWCTAEAASPQQAIEFLRHQAAADVLEGLAQDAPLHYVWMAHAAMWT